MPKVAIIVPVFNQAKYTRMFLDSLQAHTPRDLYRLIFIDNGSSDGSRELLMRHPIQVDRIVDNPTNLGVAKAWNQGIKIAVMDPEEEPESICICNNDILLFDGWLETLVSVMEKHDQWAVVPRSTSGTEDAQLYYEENVANYPEDGPDFNPLLLRGWCFLLSVKGLREMYSKELEDGFSPVNALEIALFDEQFEFAHYEDTDMDNRLRRLGKAPVEANRAFVHHFGSRTLTQNLHWLMPHIEENAAKYHKKYGQ
jgi:GT2 family glycosyltransferase